VTLVKKESPEEYRENESEFDYSSLQVISVSNAARLHEGHVKVQGVISAISPLGKLFESFEYECRNCKEINDMPCIRWADGKPELYQKIREPKKCISCEESVFDSKCKYINAITIELRDTNTFSDIDPLQAVLLAKDTENNVYSHIGERVTASGQIHVIQYQQQQQSSKRRIVSYLYVKSIKYESFQEISISKSDKEAIERFTRLLMDNNKNEKFPKLTGRGILDILANMLASEVIGYNHVKKGLLLSAASTGIDLKQKKINTVLVGDPGTAKSLLLRNAVKIVPNSRFESGQNSSGKSLTAIVSKEDDGYVLRIGPVPAAKGAICAINEIGRMDFEDQKHLLDIMQEQEFTINKYGINSRVQSPTAIIASANPLKGEWRDSERIDLTDFPVLKPLIDRFDLIFPFRKTRDEKIIKEYSDKKFELDDKLIPNYSAYLQKHIEYCKRFNPRLSEESKFMLKEYYISIAKNYGSPRVRETIITIAKMISRLKLKNIVDAEDSIETMEFYNVILQQLEQVINVTTSPADATFEECFEVLKSASFAVSFEELIKSACCRNERVKYYVDEVYKLSENKKLRPICDKLQTYSHVITVGERPIGFRWVKDSNSNNMIYDSSDKNDADIGDLNDLCDPTTSHKKQNNSINNEKSESKIRSQRSQRSPIADKNHLDNSSINSSVRDSNKTTDSNSQSNDE
jgi:replicative DNA helicase Mcm